MKSGHSFTTSCGTNSRSRQVGRGQTQSGQASGKRWQLKWKGQLGLQWGWDVEEEGH